jgi:hypothetical protein
VSKFSPFSGYTATPIEQVSRNSRLPTTNGRRTDSTSFAAMRAASSMGEVGEQHREFVAALAPDQVRGAQRRQQPRRAVAQQLVAGDVAERVVDVLEAVEVDEQQRHLAAVAPRALDRGADALAHQGAVRQVGEQVAVMADALPACLRSLMSTNDIA